MLPLIFAFHFRKGVRRGLIGGVSEIGGIDERVRYDKVECLKPELRL